MKKEDRQSDAPFVCGGYRSYLVIPTTAMLSPTSRLRRYALSAKKVIRFAMACLSSCLHTKTIMKMQTRPRSLSRTKSLRGGVIESGSNDKLKAYETITKSMNKISLLDGQNSPDMNLIIVAIP